MDPLISAKHLGKGSREKKMMSCSAEHSCSQGCGLAIRLPVPWQQRGGPLQPDAKNPVCQGLDDLVRNGLTSSQQTKVLNQVQEREEEGAGPASFRWARDLSRFSEVFGFLSEEGPRGGLAVRPGPAVNLIPSFVWLGRADILPRAA
ncbi:NPH1 [Symbiodinium microadriaticum]|nr:NPH1 [Symbiodinium microadriaticum]